MCRYGGFTLLGRGVHRGFTKRGVHKKGGSREPLLAIRACVGPMYWTIGQV